MGCPYFPDQQTPPGSLRPLIALTLREENKDAFRGVGGGGGGLSCRSPERYKHVPIVILHLGVKENGLDSVYLMKARHVYGTLFKTQEVLWKWREQLGPLQLTAFRPTDSREQLSRCPCILKTEMLYSESVTNKGNIPAATHKLLCGVRPGY